MAKLILTPEVTGLGEPGDVVTVKDGYARNYLVPRGLATAWSKGAESEITASGVSSSWATIAVKSALSTASSSRRRLASFISSSVSTT